MLSINSRVDIIIIFFLKNKAGFNEEAGYRKQKIYGITTGKVWLDIDFLYRVANDEKIKEVSTRWMLIGEGNTLSSSPPGLTEEPSFVKRMLRISTTIEELLKKESSSLKKAERYVTVIIFF